MIVEKFFARHGFDDLVAYTGKDITDEMIDECIKQAANFYDKNFVWGPATKNIVKKFNKFCFVFRNRDTRQIVGHSFWFPIKTSVFNNFIKSNEMLLDIKEEYFADYENAKKTVNLFQAAEAYVPGYDLANLHRAVEDHFQSKVLSLAHNGIKIKYIALESCCKFDEYLVSRLGLTQKVQKPNTTFYYDIYSPKKVYKESREAKDLEEFYK